MPYMTEVYYYLGKSNEYFTQGNCYSVIEVGVFVEECYFGKGKDFVKY